MSEPGIQFDRSVAFFKDSLEAHLATMRLVEGLGPALASLSSAVYQSLLNGGKVLLFGNGGSAADSQHLAAELVNRFVLERDGYAALALTTDSSVLTSIANDYSYDNIFSRQIESLGKPGDVALGISTSGNSPNVVRGLEVARQRGLITASFTGQGGGKMAGLSDHLLAVPSKVVGRIQEAHIFLGHILCELVEAGLAARKGGAAPAHPESKGFQVHGSAFVDAGAQVGEGTRIWHFSHVQPGARIGRDCNLGQNVNVDRDAVIGDRVKIQNNVSVYKGVVIGDDCFLGPSAVFTNVTNPRSEVNRRGEFRETRLGRGVTVGANATIVCGHHLGEYAFVGAGAVVTRDVPAFGLVTGNPARLVGWMCRCGIRLPLKATGPAGEATQCEACSARFTRLESGIGEVT